MRNGTEPPEHMKREEFIMQSGKLTRASAELCEAITGNIGTVTSINMCGFASVCVCMCDIGRTRGIELNRRGMKRA